MRAADRLQFVFETRHQLEQLANVEPRAVFEAELGGRLLGHPHGNVETLASWGFQGIGRGWSLAAFPDPQELAGEGVKRVENLDASITRSLL